MGKIVYILSDNRSGSTLLDQLLGAHDEVVSLGEVHHLPAYVLNDRTIYNPMHPLNCSCGKKVASCPFWQKVEQNLGRSLSTLQLALRSFGRKKAQTAGRLQSFKDLPKRMLTRNPDLFMSSFVQRALNSPRVATDSFALFDAVFAASGARYLVDSSKLPFRFRSLYASRPDRMVAIALARNYRGAVHSKMKRGSDLESGARSWALRMREIAVLTRDVSKQQLIRVKYEDLCEDPRRELGRLCNFLQIDFADKLLARPTEDVHHIGGSPSKFDPSRTAIKPDLAYQTAFSENDLCKMKLLVGKSAEEWGYE